MTTELARGVEEILNGAVANGVVPGAVFGVTGRDGDAALLTAGTLRVGDDDPATTATMFRLMSLTKAFGSVGALQLIEQGELELDQDVASVLPAFGELKVLEGFDGDQPRLREPKRQATIRNLLTHTSGCAYGFCNENLLRYHELTGLPDPLSGLRSGLQAPLVAEPGTEWNYGISFDWLGQVIEAVTGQDLATYLQENVFAPLGMNDTTFAPSQEQRGRMMAIHGRSPDGGLMAVDIEVLVDEPEFWPSGHGAHGTASDFSRLMAAMLGDGELGGERILRPETVQLAFTDHLGGIPLPEVIKSAQPEYSNDVPRAPFPQGYGLGFHVFTEDLPGMRHAGSGDWAGLMNCYYWIDRASGIAATFLTQVLPFFDAKIVATTLALEQAIYAGT